jgi:hypothetical protein
LWPYRVLNQVMPFTPPSHDPVILDEVICATR